MKRILVFFASMMAFSLQAASGHTDKIFPPPQPLSADAQDPLDVLRKIEAASALAKTGAVVVYAIAPDFYNIDPQTGDGSIHFIKQLGGMVNKLATYALLEQSQVMRFTRILEAVATNESWHTAPRWENMKDFNKFLREFAVAFARGATTEVACYLQGKAIGAVLDEDTHRLIQRATYGVATTLTVGLLKAAFNALDEKVNNKECSDSLVGILAEQFYRELAFHIAGELIRQGVARGCKRECLDDAYEHREPVIDLPG